MSGRYTDNKNDYHFKKKLRRMLQKNEAGVTSSSLDTTENHQGNETTRIEDMKIKTTIIPDGFQVLSDSDRAARRKILAKMFPSKKRKSE